MINENDRNLCTASIVAPEEVAVNSGSQIYINTHELECAKGLWELVGVVLSGEPAEALRGNLGYCARCGCEDVMVKVGKPPHAYSLNCADCERWIKWLNKRAIVFVGGAE